MKLPIGFSIEDVRDIVKQYRVLLKEVEDGTELNLHEWSSVSDERPHGDNYVDRFLIVDDVEYCVTTSYEEDDYGTTYVSEYVYVTDADGAVSVYCVPALQKMVQEYDSDNLQYVAVNPVTDKVISMDWEFVMRYYPNYEHADEIGWEDDLYCFLYDHCDEEKEKRVKYQWGETEEELIEAHNELLTEIQERAYENYKQLKSITE